MRARFSATVMAFSMAAVFAPAVEAQEWHQGRGRMDGVVQNSRGEALVGATIALRFNGGAGTDVKSDKSGHWAVLGLTGGNWEVDFSAPGYQPKKISLSVSEINRMPPIKIQLEPEAQRETETPRVEVRVAGKTISKEAAAALERGNAAMKAKNYGEAEESFLKVLPELPEEPSLLYSLALNFYFDDKTDRALEFARKTVAVDPQKVDGWLMISELELQKGNLDAGLEALGKVPADRITSPEPYMNVGILSYNKKRYPEAEQAFSKALALKPDLSQAFYYRGLERLAAKRTAEAKADLQKSLELAPNGADAETAKEILKTIK